MLHYFERCSNEAHIYGETHQRQTYFHVTNYEYTLIPPPPSPMPSAGWRPHVSFVW